MQVKDIISTRFELRRALQLIDKLAATMCVLYPTRTTIHAATVSYTHITVFNSPRLHRRRNVCAFVIFSLSFSRGLATAPPPSGCIKGRISGWVWSRAKSNEHSEQEMFSVDSVTLATPLPFTVALYMYVLPLDR